MATKRLINQGPEVTRTLAPEELNARRKRKAFTTPLDRPAQSIEPARTGRRTVAHRKQGGSVVGTSDLNCLNGRL